jgi:hypothetical protein
MHEETLKRIVSNLDMPHWHGQRHKLAALSAHLRREATPEDVVSYIDNCVDWQATSGAELLYKIYAHRWRIVVESGTSWGLDPLDFTIVVSGTASPRCIWSVSLSVWRYNGLFRRPTVKMTLIKPLYELYN